MEFSKPSVVPALLILLLVLAMAAAGPGIALKLEPTGTSSHIPPILDCAPARSDNHSAFRGNVLALLGALPVSAAAAPTGFAAAQSGGAVGGDRAFARALCFGLGARGGSSADDCRECLSAAAQDVADGCHGRLGAVWRGGCFLSYADTNASTAREDAWRGWFYDDTPTAAVASQCVANGTTAECSRCLNESAKVVPELMKEDRRRSRKLSWLHRDAVVVVGYSCYLRVPLFPPLPRWESYLFGFIGGVDVVGVLIIEVVGLLFCINEAREFNLHEVAAADH